MKVKAVISKGAPVALFDAFGGVEFVRAFLVDVLGGCLGVANPTERPAEYYVQEPDSIITISQYIGVELRLTGVSREGRSAKQFHNALKELQTLATRMIAVNLKTGRVQLFCVIMLDGEVENPPGSGKYSNVLESEAVWIETSSHRAE